MALQKKQTGTSKIASGQLSTLPTPVTISFPSWMIEKYPELSAMQSAINKFTLDVVQTLSSLSTTYPSIKTGTSSTSADSSQSTNSSTTTAVPDEIQKQIDGISGSLSEFQKSLSALSAKVSTIVDNNGSCVSTIKEVKATISDLSAQFSSVAASIPSLDGVRQSIAELRDTVAQEAIARAQNDAEIRVSGMAEETRFWTMML